MRDSPRPLLLSLWPPAAVPAYPPPSVSLSKFLGFIHGQGEA
jgi:hypothetical protein